MLLFKNTKAETSIELKAFSTEAMSNLSGSSTNGLSSSSKSVIRETRVLIKSTISTASSGKAFFNFSKSQDVLTSGIQN